jgi:hypothetical protein
MAKIPYTMFLLSFALVLSAAISSQAQGRAADSPAADEFVISAKAGGISQIEGPVSVVRPDGSRVSPTKRGSLEAGERLATGEGGFAEVMLNPGSFARIGSQSEFAFVSTDLDRLVVELKSGSAVFEVFAADDFAVLVKTPWADFPVTRSGVFRVDVLEDTTSRLSVWKGNLVVGRQRRVLKGGHALIAKGSTGGVTKFKRGDKDALDVWSESRAKRASQANAKLQRKTMTGALVSSFNQGGWDLYRNLGVWVWDSARNTYFFLPFGNGWRSPYGYGFGYDIWNFNLPIYVYYPNPTGAPRPGGGTSTSGSGGLPGGEGTGNGEGLPRPGTGSPRTETREASAMRTGEVPVFLRFEATQRAYGNSPVVSGGNGGFGGGVQQGTWGPSSGAAPSSGGFPAGPSSGGGMIEQRPSGPPPQSSAPIVSAPVGPVRVETNN